MPTPATHTLDELEIALDTATAQMQQLSEENARLRSQLAEASERMRVAGHKLRVVAERLPQAAVAVDAINTNGAEVAQSKAA